MHYQFDPVVSRRSNYDNNNDDDDDDDDDDDGTRLNGVQCTVICEGPVSYTHLTLPTNREV